jgi:hypothetical protein
MVKAIDNKTDVPSPFKSVFPVGLGIGKDKLLMELFIYQESIVLREITTDGGGVYRIVDPQDLAKALTRDLVFASGLLPENALWWSNTKIGSVVALWEEQKSGSWQSIQPHQDRAIQCAAAWIDFYLYGRTRSIHLRHAAAPERPLR